MSPFPSRRHHRHLRRSLLVACFTDESHQLVVLTPYLAQLRELRDAMDGTVSAQDASDLAAAIRLGDANADQDEPKGGGGGDLRSRVRVATGERVADRTFCASNLPAKLEISLFE